MRKSYQDADRCSSAQQKRRAARKALSVRKRRTRNRLRYLGEEIILRAPPTIGIQHKVNRRFTVKFIGSIRRYVLGLRRRVRLDFTNTTNIYPTGGLLLTAELDRMKRIAKDAFEVSIVPSKIERINAVLIQVGISSICDSPLEEGAAMEDETVKHWRYATGERINQQTTRAFEQFEGRLADKLRKGMWKSISEAIANSAEHAYLQPRGTDGGRLGRKRWWMFSQERDNELTVVVCDLGIGIPRSLPLKWEPGTLRKIYDGVVGQGPDVRAIQAAMKVGASSTGRDHRGRGLPQIWHELRSMDAKGVGILSNCGSLIWDGESGQERAKEFSESIHGTVIAWTVPLGT